MIQVENLTKKYGTKTAVQNISFQVPDGKVVGFLGPNGAGKSTTMRCILGLDRPTSGVITVDGKVYKSSNQPLASVGALIDAKAFQKSRSARAHLQMIAATNNIPRKRVNEVIEQAGIKSVARHKAGTFSLGMAQRIGIAAALLGNPKTLILDEPVNGLDPEGVIWIRDLCRKHAANGGSVLISSHLMSEIEQTVDEVIIIGQGSIIDQGAVGAIMDKTSPNVLLTKTPQREKLIWMLSENAIEYSLGKEVEDVAEVYIKDAQIENLAQLIAMNSIEIYELTPQKSTLEDAFLKLTHDSVEYKAKNISARDTQINNIKVEETTQGEK